MSASTLRQLCNVANDSLLIENNRVTWKWVYHKTALTIMLGVNGSLGPVYTKRQWQHCDNSVMTLAILFSMKSVESLENRLQPHSGATPLFSIRTESQASSLSCRSVDADAWCKQVLRLHLVFFWDSWYKASLNFVCCFLSSSGFLVTGQKVALLIESLFPIHFTTFDWISVTNWKTNTVCDSDTRVSLFRELHGTPRVSFVIAISKPVSSGRTGYHLTGTGLPWPLVVYPQWVAMTLVETLGPELSVKFGLVHQENDFGSHDGATKWNSKLNWSECEKTTNRKKQISYGSIWENKRNQSQ